mgnify:CR=1 FL=1
MNENGFHYTEMMDKIMTKKVQENECDFKDYGDVERVCKTCGFVTIKTDKGVDYDLKTTISDTGDIPKCKNK